MRIEKLISHDTKKRLDELKRDIDPDKQFRETERMMGKYNRTLHRSKGGAWK